MRPLQAVGGMIPPASAWQQPPWAPSLPPHSSTAQNGAAQNVQYSHVAIDSHLAQQSPADAANEPWSPWWREVSARTSVQAGATVLLASCDPPALAAAPSAATSRLAAIPGLYPFCPRGSI